MNPDRPEYPDRPSEADDGVGPYGPVTPPIPWAPAPPRRKFQHNYPRHLLLFTLTLLTTTWIGSLWAGQPLSFQGLLAGLWYSVPLMTILTAHEFGHYFACRYYDVDATLPYYLPVPLPPAGTFGAVIRIREPFPSKRALFDIGVAGPLAGFVALLPFLLIGLFQSNVGTVPPDAETIYFGEPLLWKMLEWLYFGPLENGMDVFIEPMGLAAWFGMIVTAINLLPFGQLDGGHIMYAAVGRHARRVSIATLVVVLLLTLYSVNWILMALILVVVSVTVGFGHPRVIDEDAALDPRRRIIAVVAFVIFALCFVPVPITMMEM